MADSKQSKPDEDFWRVADSFVAHANAQADNTDRGVVSAGFAYSSARFNAFVIASQCGNKESFEAEKAKAIEYFVEQYKLALTENVADYSANFDKYISQSN
ncbi:MAG TPA: DUF3144 domain-containing protein [Methylotenera sp.]|nr:DUF3144 domain-containing protein [Methylotenera sp.]